MSIRSTISSSSANVEGVSDLSSAFLWCEQARLDYRLARIFADIHGARLSRSTKCQRVGWGDGADIGYGMVLPDLTPPKDLKDDDWYIYNVDVDLLLRVGNSARERASLIILPESVEDWVELLRQAVSEKVFDIGYSAERTYINAFGESALDATGCLVTIRGQAPQAISAPSFEISGSAETPERAARECCRKWLDRSARDQSLSNL